MKIIKPISRVICFCCLSRKWMKKHMPNDWLAGAWFIYWAMVLATVASFAILIYTLLYCSLVNKFVLACGLVAIFADQIIINLFGNFVQIIFERLLSIWSCLLRFRILSREAYVC